MPPASRITRNFNRLSSAMRRFRRRRRARTDKSLAVSPGLNRISSDDRASDMGTSWPPCMDARADRTVSLEEWEYARAVVAYAITLHGPVYAPILDRIEREIEAARKADPVARGPCHPRDLRDGG